MKTIFITGASSGFGEACAQKFAANGWRLVITARRLERLQNLKLSLDSKVPVHVAELDVTSLDQIQFTIENLPREFSEIDLLLNNAGLALGLRPAQEANLDEWEKMIDTNIKGLVYCTRLILPGMVSRNRGHVINIGSIAGSWPYPGGNVYGATKAFVQQFSRNLRSDLVGTNVRVTNIEPGLAETEFSVVRFQGDQSKADQIYRGTQPLVANDIAEAVFWSAIQPAHVNINSMEIMPTCQAWAGSKIVKQDQ